MVTARSVLSPGHRAQLAKTMTSPPTTAHRAPTAFRFGLLALALAATAAAIRLGYLAEAVLPSILFGLLAFTTLGFAYDALRRSLGVHALPFVWASLALLEFVISPSFDIATGSLTLESERQLAGFERAILACWLFVVGTWIGWRFALSKAPADRRYPLESPEPTRTHRFLPLLLLAFVGLALSAATYVIGSSGALSGDLRYARGEGLIGTTVLLPLLRLADLASLVASWLSVTASAASARRRYFVIALVALCAAVLMPIALQQRFGVLQALAYFALPRLARNFSASPVYRARLLSWLPLLLVGVLLSNAATALIREFVVGGERVALDVTFAQRILQGEGGSHFRHARLLATLIENGADERHFGGLYDGVPFVGDLLIIVPRVLVPDKPLTTMEIVNSLAMGRSFTALDRGSAAIYTSSLWVQLYLFGGLWSLLPLAAAFASLTFVAWQAAMRRTHSAVGVAITGVLWIQCGWLSYNVAFTTIEIPGMMVAASALALLPMSRVAGSRLSVGRH